MSLAWVLLLVLLTVVSVNAGTVYASDAAVPGQALYSLDRTIERLRATLTRDPEAAAELQLDFADERLSEARLLIEEEDTVHFNEALAGYGDAISTAADAVESAGATAGDGLALLLEESMAGQDTQLAGLFVPIGDEALDGDAAANRFCSEGEAHPVAQSIAERYGTDVGQIMDWFCGSGEAPGIGFGQIMLALRGQAALGSGGPSAEELLERRANGEGWGQIWKDLGVAGKPAGVGPPEHAGPKDKARGPEEAGPPDRAGPKNGN